MGRRPKQPNHQLGELLYETRASRKGFARRIVERGRGIGIELRYDHTSVGRWLAGEQPTSPGPNLIAEVLTELCGRRFLEGTAYAVASMRWLTLPGREHPASATGLGRIGVSDIGALRTMTTAFRDLDNQVGGGKVRSTVVHYLHTSVAPLLRASYTEEVGRRLFAATAELTKLAGWAAYDLEEHGLAQRYLIQALRMARAAGDTALGAEILAAMSHQATYVGRPGDAVDLARAAQIAARSAGLPALEAGCYMVEAHGHAARSDARSCANSLNAAEGAFDRDGSNRPPWLFYLDTAYMAAKAAQCFRDLGENDRAAEIPAVEEFRRQVTSARSE